MTPLSMLCTENHEWNILAASVNGSIHRPWLGAMRYVPGSHLRTAAHWESVASAEGRCASSHGW